MLKEIWDYRQMIISLVRKDLRGRYKGSVLGFLWTFVNPLFQLIIYTVVFTYLLPSGIDKYYLFLFVALIPWIFFSSAVVGGSTSILSQKDLVKKIYFPREVLPISYVTSCFVNMLFCFIIVFAVVLISKTSVHPLGIVYLPVVMIVEYFLALGIAMITSAITVYSGISSISSVSSRWRGCILRLFFIRRLCMIIFQSRSSSAQSTSIR